MIAEFERQITPRSGRTLIVGSRLYGDKEDRRKRYPNAEGVDMVAGPGVDWVQNLEHKFYRKPYDHIECMSVLEHCRKPWLVADSLEQLLYNGGTLFVTVPFIWRVHNYPDDYWRFTMSGVKSLFSRIEWTHEAYSHRHLCKAEDIPAVKAGEDWPHFARTEVCLFGAKRA